MMKSKALKIEEMIKWISKRILSYILTDKSIKLIVNKRKYFEFKKRLISLDIKKDTNSIIQKNKYRKKYILKKEVIKRIIEEIKKEDNVKSLNEFGIGNPVINYITLYETINHKDNHEISINASHWHTDDTIHARSVKIFQLIEKITIENGPFTFISREDTVKNWKRLFFRGRELTIKSKEIMYLSNKESLWVDARSCLHRAGVPAKNKKRDILMIQVVDKKGEEDIDYLFKQQGLGEPTVIKSR